MDKREKVHKQLRDGTRMLTTIYGIADAEESLLLTTWGKLELEVSKWYQLHYLSVSTYGGVARLSTTRTTTATTIRSKGTAVPPPLDDTEQFHGEIVGANATCIHKCPKGHLVNTFEPTSPMTHCQYCPSYYKTAKLLRRWEATITVELAAGHNSTFTLDDIVLKSTIAQDILDQHSPEALVATLLSMDMVAIGARFAHAFSLQALTPTRAITEEPTDDQLLSMATSLLP